MLHDELRRLMGNGEAFPGFNEAPISFPPTFKYDVLKRSKSLSIRERITGRPSHSTRATGLSEIEERDFEIAAPSEKSGITEAADAVDGMSIRSASITAASSPSLHHMDWDDDSHSLALFETSREEAMEAIQDAAGHIPKAAIKAKEKFLSSLPSFAARSPDEKKGRALKAKVNSRRIHQVFLRNKFLNALRNSSNSEVGFSPAGSANDLLNVNGNQLSSTSLNLSIASTDVEVGGEYRYDTSSKRRVPSWYV